ncbi:MAG: hypothetical protein ACOC4J_06540 [Bacteroidota bacterium]
MKIVILSLLFIFNTNTPPEPPDAYFEDKYDDALQFYKRHDGRIDKIIEELNGEKYLIYSIGFPELIRYNMWKDLFETKANELLYAKKGKSYAFFSIGRFQMKPLFAEKVEKYIEDTDTLNHEYGHVIAYDVNGNIRAVRKERIERLKSYKWQIRYLVLFTQIVTHRFDLSAMQDSTDRIEFFCSAYNHDFLTDSAQIARMKNKKFFPYGSKRDNPFSYSEVAVYFFENDYPSALKGFFW